MLNLTYIIAGFLLACAYGFMVSVISFVYTNLLTKPSEIFHGLYVKLFYAAQGSQCTPRDPFEVWWFRILIYCEKCNAGHLALWTFPFIIGIHDYSWISVPINIFACGWSILLVSILKSLYNKWVN